MYNLYDITMGSTKSMLVIISIVFLTCNNMVLDALIWVWKVCDSMCYNLIKEMTIINEKNDKKYMFYNWTCWGRGIIIKTLQKS